MLSESDPDDVVILEDSAKANGDTDYTDCVDCDIDDGHSGNSGAAESASREQVLIKEPGMKADMAHSGGDAMGKNMPGSCLQRISASLKRSFASIFNAFGV